MISIVYIVVRGISKQNIGSQCTPKKYSNFVNWNLKQYLNNNSVKLIKTLL
jgi:hypothetical protein